jgi:hypothetical protein
MCWVKLLTMQSTICLSQTSTIQKLKHRGSNKILHKLAISTFCYIRFFLLIIQSCAKVDKKKHINLKEQKFKQVPRNQDLQFT